MAGYMRKLNGHIYDGANEAGEILANGLFVELSTTSNVTTVKKTTAVKNTIMRVADKTTLWGMDALVLDVVSVGTDEVFFVENEWDIRDNEDYDTSKYQCNIGDFVKMHRPLVGEQQILTVESTLYASLLEGDKVQPAANGTVAKTV